MLTDNALHSDPGTHGILTAQLFLTISLIGCQQRVHTPSYLELMQTIMMRQIRLALDVLHHRDMAHTMNTRAPPLEGRCSRLEARSDFTVRFAEA